MFAKTLEAEYTPLSEAKSSLRYLGLHFLFITLELTLLAFLFAGFLMLQSQYTAVGGMDGLTDLRDSANTTMVFRNQSHLLKAGSEEANNYWQKLLSSGGVISLDTKWAHSQGLRKSATSPTDETQSIYQVDVFHALHCLNAIRENLMSDVAPPWDEKHMLHCLDYIRHELLCNPDLTLVTTNDLEEFVLDEAHQCRDFGTIMKWVDRHRWVEFPEWLKAKTVTKANL